MEAGRLVMRTASDAASLAQQPQQPQQPQQQQQHPGAQQDGEQLSAAQSPGLGWRITGPTGRSTLGAQLPHQTCIEQTRKCKQFSGHRRVG